MKKKEKSLILDRAGVDEASGIIGQWLSEAGADRRDILRIRLCMEELLDSAGRHSEGKSRAVLSFVRGIGTYTLKVRYDGERYDPTRTAESEAQEYTAGILTVTGILPQWRWRSGRNELVLHIPDPKARPEFLMLGCIAAAVIVGVAGQFLPEAFKSAVTDYGLSFLSQGFLNLLNTFIGLMIFLTVITGICGIGSAAALGRMGKKMMVRFISLTFILGGACTAVLRLVFPLGQGAAEGGSQGRAVLEMIFGILPSNPVKPFLDGNTLQIVFMAVLIGIVLLLTGSQTEDLRRLLSQAQILIMRCISVVCVLLPVYIFTSLVKTLWQSGLSVLLQMWKPLTVCIVLSVVQLAVYLGYTCRKLNAAPGLLVKKLMPDFIIGLSTASSAAAMSLGMEINEKQLGIDPAFSRMAHPIGGILLAPNTAVLYGICGVFIAECYGMQAGFAWWITLWIVCSLLGIASPPVAGGTISCLSVMLVQMNLPAEGLALGAALAMFLDFITTGTRIPLLHMELALQADSLGLLDHDILSSKDGSH